MSAVQAEPHPKLHNPSTTHAEVVVRREALNAALDPRQTESKLSLALDAVRHNKGHADKSVNAYFDVLLQVLNSFPVIQSRQGAFDARVLVTIDASLPFINEYRSLMLAIAASEETERFNGALTRFLSGVLELKTHFKLGSTSAYLWLDALGFIARELFLSTLAPLLEQRRWSSVQALVTHDYQITEQHCRFHAFDGFQRSLDVFRRRRLKLNRLSVSADLLRKRLERTELDFDSVMQADFVLHLITVLGDDPVRHSWFARTLGFAESYIASGFDVFVSARAGKADEFLTRVMGVASWPELMTRIEQLAASCVICHPETVDYAGLMAANTAIFDRRPSLS